MNHSKVFRLPVIVLSAVVLYSCASAPVQKEPVSIPEQTAEDILSGLSVPASQETDTESPLTTVTIEASEVVITAEPEKTRIIKHKGTEAGINLIPLWVDAYLSGGTEAVASMKEFEDKICYVNEASSLQLSEAYEQALAEVPDGDASEVAGWWMLVHMQDAESPENKFQDRYFVYILYTSPKSTEPLN